MEPKKVAPFSSDAFHDALDGGLAEVVRVGLHGQTVDADDDVFLLALFCRRIRFAVAVCARDLQNAVRDEVLSGAVGLHDGFDQVLRHILVVGKQLLGVFGQAVSAVAKRRIVIIVTDSGIEADALDDLGGVLGDRGRRP